MSRVSKHAVRAGWLAPAWRRPGGGRKQSTFVSTLEGALRRQRSASSAPRRRSGVEARPEPEPSQKPPRLGCWAAGAERLKPATVHEVEVLARALLGVAAALGAVPLEHGQAQLQGCATDWAAGRLAAVARKAGRRLALPMIEEEGLLPTSLPLGLALLVVACELALPSRHAKSTTKETTRIMNDPTTSCGTTSASAPGRDKGHSISGL